MRQNSCETIGRLVFVLSIGHSDFRFVSDFVLWISSFEDARTMLRRDAISSTGRRR
jgi:hypothetical protein